MPGGLGGGLRDLVVRITADLSGFRSGIRRASTSISNFGRRTESWSQRNSAAFKKAGLAAAAFTGVMTVALKKGTDVALDFEEQMAKVETMLTDNIATSVDEVAMSMAEFNKQLPEMSQLYGQSTATLSDGLYDVLSAGVPAAKAMDMVDKAARTAAAGFTETGTVIEVMLTVMEAYGDEVGSAAKASDMLTNTVKVARTTMGEMSSQIGRIIPLGKQFGLTLDGLLGYFSQLTLSLGSTELATTSLSAIMQTFASPTEEAEKAFAHLTEELTGTAMELDLNTLKSLGLSGVLDLLSKAEGKYATTIFKSRQALRGIGALVEKRNEAQEKSRFILEKEGSTEENLARIREKSFFKLKQAGQAFIETIRGAFETALPTLNDFAERITGLFKDFQSLSPEVKTGAVNIALLATAFGGLVIVLSTAGLLIGKLIGGLVLLKGAVIAVNAQLFLFAGFLRSVGAMGFVKFLALAVAKLLAAAAAGYALGAAIRWVANKFFKFDETIQKVIGSVLKFIGLDYAKPAAQVTGLSKKLAELNKKYGIQAKTIYEALKLIREKNKASKEGIEEEKKGVDELAKKNKEAELAFPEGGFKGRGKAKEAEKLEKAIRESKLKTLVEALELDGKEKEARLALLEAEYKERLKIQGKNLELEHWYQLSKKNIAKEFSENENELIESIKFEWSGYYDWKTEKIEEEFFENAKRVEDLEAAERVYIKGIETLNKERAQKERSLIEETKFEWSGYYDWKTEKIEEEFFENAKRVEDLEIAERVYIEEIKALNKDRISHRENIADEEIRVLRKKLNKMLTMNEEFYALADEIAMKSNERAKEFGESGEDLKSRLDIVKEYSDQTQQSWTEMFQGMGDSMASFGQKQVDFYQEGADLMQTFADGLTSTFEDSFVNLVKGDFNSIGEAWDDFATNMAETFIRMVARMIIKWLIFKAIQMATGGGAAGAIGSAAAGAEQGGLIPGYQMGGSVLGASGPGDNVPANLKGGEFVVRKESINQDTLKQLQAINQRGRAPGSNVTVESSPQIVNFTDPRLVQDYIANNPDAIVNIVSSDAASDGRMRSSMRRMGR